MRQDVIELLKSIDEATIKMRSIYAKWARIAGISYAEMLILYHLRDNEDACQSEICSHYITPKQTVSNAISRLKKLGYLKYLDTCTDKREKHFTLSEDGKEYSDRILSSINKIEEKAIDEMGFDNVKRLSDLSKEFGDLLQEELSKL